MDDPEKQSGTFSMLLLAFCIISQSLVDSTWSNNPEKPNMGQIRQYVLAVWPWNFTDDLEKQ